MVRSSLSKLAIAFLVGLILALGSALVFVRTHQPQQVVPIVEVQQEPPAVEAEQKAEPPAPRETATAPLEGPVEKARSKASAAATAQRAKRSSPRILGKSGLSPNLPSPNLPPVQVVQNTPPALPGAAAPAYPALSEPVQEETAPTAAAQAPAEPHVVELAAGTNLAIRLGETISTEHNYTGDVFRGTLEESIIRNGFIIADKGSKVLGRIVTAAQAGRVRGVSNLNVTLTEINTTDGQRIKVETNSVEKSGQASTGTDTAKIAGGAALGAIIGALGGGGKGAAIGAGAGGAAGTGLVLATRGKPAVLPSESRLTFQLISPVTITEKLN